VTQFRASFLVITLLATVSSYANAQGLPPLAHLMVGSEFKYTVKAGDSLVSFGARVVGSTPGRRDLSRSASRSVQKEER
jgi:hypothetical protein